LLDLWSGEADERFAAPMVVGMIMQVREGVEILWASQSWNLPG
jgi:hypothetical protein